MQEITGKYIQISSYRIHYEFAGNGRPVVCLPTAGASACEYRQLLPLLADLGYCAIAVDPPGHGNSFPDLRDLSIPSTPEAYVDFIWDFCKALKLERPAFIGFAMSGSMLLLLAAKYGPAIGAVVAGGANAKGRMDPRQLAALNHPSVNTADMMTVTTPPLCAPGQPETTIHECIWHNARSVVPEAIETDLSIYDLHDVTGLLSAIQCPVLHLYGEYDSTVSEESKTLIRQKLPHVRQVELKDTGHYGPVENASGICEAVRSFFEDSLLR